MESPKSRGAWWATVHGVAKSWMQLRDFTFFLSFFLSPPKGTKWLQSQPEQGLLEDSKSNDSVMCEWAEGCSAKSVWRGVPLPSLSPPAGPGWGSRTWTPSVQSQREAGLHRWGHSFNSDSLTSGHIHVTSFIPLGLCSESQHVGGLALLGGLAAFNWCCPCIRGGVPSQVEVTPWCPAQAPSVIML